MTDTLAIKITKATSSKLPNVDFENLPFGKTFSDHMLIADYADGEWKNFEIVPFGEIGLSPAISALHYGQSFFEGLKAYRHDDGKISVFRPDKNAKRFNKSAERMCMPTLPEELFTQSIAALVDLDRDWVPSKEGYTLYIRPFMFATDEYLGVRTALNYRFMIIMSPAGSYYTKPPKVKVEKEFIRAAPGGVGFAKCAGNYAASLYPAKLAADQGYTQLLWTDALEHKYFEESGTMNVVFVKNGTIITPAVSSTILKGTTREALLQIAKDKGYEVEERKVSVEEIIHGLRDGSVTEVFGVGTAVVVSPFSAVGYEGEDLPLPEVTELSVSQILKTALNNIRTGKEADKYGWVWRV